MSDGVPGSEADAKASASAIVQQIDSAATASNSPGSRVTAGTTSRRRRIANPATAIVKAMTATASTSGENVIPTAIRRMPTTMTTVAAAVARP